MDSILPTFKSDFEHDFFTKLNVSSYLHVGEMIDNNTSKRRVEQLLDDRMKIMGDNVEYLWFPISLNPGYNLILVRVGIICKEYIANITYYKFPNLTPAGSWNYKDDIEKSNDSNGLDYDIIERLISKEGNIKPKLYESLLNIFKKLYNMGYWTYGGFKNYVPTNDIPDPKQKYLMHFNLQRGIRFKMDLNGNISDVSGILPDELKNIGLVW